MAIAQCPHMAARCPHYHRECDDPESKSCFYVKDTTYTALANLHHLRGLAQNSPFDAKLQGRIDALRKFVEDSKI
jgi:hypothetical protein